MSHRWGYPIALLSPQPTYAKLPHSPLQFFQLIL